MVDKVKGFVSGLVQDFVNDWAGMNLPERVFSVLVILMTLVAVVGLAWLALVFVAWLLPYLVCAALGYFGRGLLEKGKSGS